MRAVLYESNDGMKQPAPFIQCIHDKVGVKCVRGNIKEHELDATQNALYVHVYTKAISMEII